MARPEGKLKELKTAELRNEIGARSDLVVRVNRRSERRIIPYGEEFLFEKLPVGTRVIYPPPPMDPLADPDQAVRYALLHPENQDPLFAQLSGFQFLEFSFRPRHSSLASIVRCRG